MKTAYFDVAVIGGGPAGLAAALAADECGAKTLLIEREAELGGILKQCVHDEFGLARFGEKLTGPEYTHRFIRRIPESGVETAVFTFVSRVENKHNDFELTLVNRDGVILATCKSIVLACGCRERTPRQTGIHGAYPAGIFTAGTAQYFTNILGKIPGKRCVILGSGDIGLIMARRLKLEGAEVLGVYEARPSANCLIHNINQCLDDFDIPLHTGKTVTRVFGEGRVTAVEITSVDTNMIPVPGTEQIIECDALILSAGLIPENELAESLGVPLDARTMGPVTDQNHMTMIDGVFCCGNALHINDLVDYVSESGESAGRAAANYAADKSMGPRSFAEMNADDSLIYTVPKKLNVNALNGPAVIFFRSKRDMGMTRLTVTSNGNETYRKIYPRLRPAEMERLELDFHKMNIRSGNIIRFSLQEVI
jgi:thioredoxin reductase